jgi:hypothetical protein
MSSPSITVEPVAVNIKLKMNKYTIDIDYLTSLHSKHLWKDMLASIQSLNRSKRNC